MSSSDDELLPISDSDDDDIFDFDDLPPKSKASDTSAQPASSQSPLQVPDSPPSSMPVSMPSSTSSGSSTPIPTLPASSIFSSSPLSSAQRTGVTPTSLPMNISTLGALREKDTLREQETLREDDALGKKDEKEKEKEIGAGTYFTSRVEEYRKADETQLSRRRTQSNLWGIPLKPRQLPSQQVQDAAHSEPEQLPSYPLSGNTP